jgi:hypothetical protein
MTASVGKDPDSTKVLYEGLRRAQTKLASGGQVTDVPGVGQYAYTYVDEALGPQLVVLDGNLYVTISWSSASFGKSAPTLDDLDARLAAVAKGTMANLRA